ncbi:MAG: hypothetical protein ABI359_01460 [Ginsengibacter sp.]
METIQKRQKLQEYIQSADAEKINALFLILESNDNNEYSYSDEDINMLYERRERYLKGEGKNFTVPESFEDIRNRK